MTCRAAALLDFVPTRDGEEAGISVYMNPDHRYEIGVGRANGRRQVFVRQRIGTDARGSHRSGAASGHGAGRPPGRGHPGGIRLFVRDRSRRAPAHGDHARSGQARCATCSSEVAGGFTGVYFGLYATGNGQPVSAPARFDWWDYEPR